MEFIEYVLASATISTLLVTALGWATKSVISERLKNAIKHEYDEKLATHKAELKAQSEVEIERLKSDLSISAFEHQVKFTNLHEKQAEIIAKTYALLKDFHAKLGDYVAIFEPVGVKPSEAFVKGMGVALGPVCRHFDSILILLAYCPPRWDEGGLGYGIPCNPMAKGGRPYH